MHETCICHQSSTHIQFASPIIYDRVRRIAICRCSLHFHLAIAPTACRTLQITTGRTVQSQSQQPAARSSTRLPPRISTYGIRQAWPGHLPFWTGLMGTFGLQSSSTNTRTGTSTRHEARGSYLLTTGAASPPRTRRPNLHHETSVRPYSPDISFLALTLDFQFCRFSFSFLLLVRASHISHLIPFSCGACLLFWLLHCIRRLALPLLLFFWPFATAATATAFQSPGYSALLSPLSFGIPRRSFCRAGSADFRQLWTSFDKLAHRHV